MQGEPRQPAETFGWDRYDHIARPVLPWRCGAAENAHTDIICFIKHSKISTALVRILPLIAHVNNHSSHKSSSLNIPPNLNVQGFRPLNTYFTITDGRDWIDERG